MSPPGTNRGGRRGFPGVEVPKNLNKIKDPLGFKSPLLHLALDPLATPCCKSLAPRDVTRGSRARLDRARGSWRRAGRMARVRRPACPNRPHRTAPPTRAPHQPRSPGRHARPAGGQRRPARPAAPFERRQLRPQPWQVEEVTPLACEERKAREVHRRLRLGVLHHRDAASRNARRIRGSGRGAWFVIR